MASFKRVDDQHTIQVEAKAASDLTLNVGDLISYIPSTQVAAKITKRSEVQTALGAGYKVLLVAQSDAVTDKSGLAYKNYNMSKTVVLGASATRIVVGYDVVDVENIVGYAAEA